MIEVASASPEEKKKKNIYICESGPNVGLLMFLGVASRLPLERFENKFSPIHLGDIGRTGTPACEAG